MKYAEMLRLAEEADIPSEAMSDILGFSTPLSKLNEQAFSTGVEQLIVDGKIDPDSELAKSVMRKSRRLPFMAAIKVLGVSDAVLNQKGSPADSLMRGISEIGAPESRRKEVDRSQKKLGTFAKIGAEWKRLIGGLQAVIRSSELNLTDKLVAYGALFYLLTPFDLIPDNIPVFGLVDDYAVMSLALIYYAKRFPKLFPGKTRA